MKSGMGYCGCATIPELLQKTRFVRISGAGLRESHVHDVMITREAPTMRRVTRGACETRTGSRTTLQSAEAAHWKASVACTRPIEPNAKSSRHGSPRSCG